MQLLIEIEGSEKDEPVLGRDQTGIDAFQDLVNEFGIRTNHQFRRFRVFQLDG